MWVLNASEMREADRRTIEELGVPGSVLMENAGRAVVDAMERGVPELRSRKIAVVCGKGNNGGDGLVVARRLAEEGYDVRTSLLARFADLSGDPKEKLEKARARGLEVREGTLELDGADVVVDAIFGTGLTRAPEGSLASAISEINRLAAFTVGVDIPSGLSSDTGRVPGVAVEADLTVALAAAKICHFLPPACFHVGRLEIADIGIAAKTIEECSGTLSTIEPGPLVARLPPRHADVHKGDFGHLLVIAGSLGKTGAAAMAARAALRCGTGLVTVACPKSTLPLIAPTTLEVMTEPLPETEGGTAALSALDRLRELAEGKSALAIGPGLGRHPETDALVRRLVGRVTLPIVVDADGVNAFAGELESLPRGRSITLTPHPGEMGRLCGTSSRDVQEDRLAVARRFATERGVYLALKGFRTLVCEPSGRAYIGTTGNPGMATGGTGDVLTGILGALLAQNLGPADALQLGVYLHGLAGDLAAEEIGQCALIATDLIRKIPAALRLLGAP